MPVIQVEHISKSYGSVKALQDVTFSVEQSELFGLIGADGAGKSTLFDILVTLLKPDEGKASLAGIDVTTNVQGVRSIVGYMPGRFSLYADLTVFENLKFFADVFNTTIEENYEAIRDIWVQIEPFRNRPAGKLSGGMKQKLALCCALVHKPTVLLLDEPTTGVDPVSRYEFWQTLQVLKTRGITILVSTPYMDEAILCDRVALIQDGKILAIDNPHMLTKYFTKRLFSVCSGSMYSLLNDLRSYSGTYSCYPFGVDVHLALKDGVAEQDVLAYLEQKSHTSLRLEPITPGIEDVFMELMIRKN